MKRVHVLEFEDLEWFPAWLRGDMTNLIVVLLRAIGTTAILSRLVSRVMADHAIEQVVDLGSGSGGIMPDVIARVRRRSETANARLLMTDLYPNPDARRRFESEGASHLRYLGEPVDASDLASAPDGLKTMVNCFHHMRPTQARLILESAVKSRQPILVYEMADNEIPFAAWCATLPIGLVLVAISSLLLTPFVRPLRARQLVFTYMIPLIPIFYAWDGQASLPRIYTFADLDELLEGLEDDHYQWETGYATNERGKGRGIYLLGCPS